MAKPRVLIASQPAAWRVLRGMLEEVMDLVPVHSIDRGLETLDGRAGGFAMVVSTVAFDESRMVDFLLAVKSRPAVSAVPFVCCRLLPTVLPGESLVRLAEVCRLAGAADFIDVPDLDQTRAVPLLRAALMKHIDPDPVPLS